MVLVARTGEPSLGRLLASLEPPGLDRGVASPWRIADSGLGVGGVAISDMLGCAALVQEYLYERLSKPVSIMQRVGTAA